MLSFLLITNTYNFHSQLSTYFSILKRYSRIWPVNWNIMIFEKYHELSNCEKTALGYKQFCQLYILKRKQHNSFCNLLSTKLFPLNRGIMNNSQLSIYQLTMGYPEIVKRDSISRMGDGVGTPSLYTSETDSSYSNSIESNTKVCWIILKQ